MRSAFIRIETDTGVDCAELDGTSCRGMHGWVWNMSRTIVHAITSRRILMEELAERACPQK